jgi:hypothetical protein
LALALLAFGAGAAGFHRHHHRFKMRTASGCSFKKLVTQCEHSGTSFFTSSSLKPLRFISRPNPFRCSAHVIKQGQPLPLHFDLVKLELVHFILLLVFPFEASTTSF